MSQITNLESSAAYKSAVDMAQAMLGEERGELNPRSTLGSLSVFEWNKLVTAAVSGWINERSRQLGAERMLDEDAFLATGEVPEPAELGLCALALPALGDLIEKLGLSDQPVGAWSKEQILLFVWTAADVMQDIRTRRTERPGPADIAPEADPSRFLMAG